MVPCAPGIYIGKCIYDEITGIITGALVRPGGACCDMQHQPFAGGKFCMAGVPINVSCFRRRHDMQHQPFAEGKFCMAGVPITTKYKEAF